MEFFKKTDIIIIGILLFISLVLWFAYRFVLADPSPKAEIYYYSQLVKTVDLNRGVDERFSIPQDASVVFHLYADGSIAFEESDCPDKVCINTGKLNTSGQFAACLPNGIVLKIVPGKAHSDEDADIIAGY